MSRIASKFDIASGEPHVPVLIRKLKSWPAPGERLPSNARLGACVPLSEALETAWEVDAHFVAYAERVVDLEPEETESGTAELGVPVRLNKAALYDICRVRLQPSPRIEMQLLVLDVDDTAAKARGEAASANWREGERLKLERLKREAPGFVRFETLGGYRLIWALASPFDLVAVDDAGEWSSFYLGAVAWVRNQTGIEADETCADWTRLYRLPNVDREHVGRQTSEIEGMLGEPWPTDRLLHVPKKARSKNQSADATDPEEGDPTIVEPLIEQLAKALEPAWCADGRQRWFLSFLGWLHGKGWAESEREEVIARLIEARDDNAERYLNMNERTHMLDGPGADVKEALGDAFEEVDRLVARRKRGLIDKWLEYRASLTAPARNDLQRCGDAADATKPSVTAGLDPAVDYVITHLAHPAVGVFQRAGKLAIVTRDARADGDVVRPIGSPTIRDLVLPRLREIIRSTVGPREVELSGEVLARGEWAHIRPLDAIVSYPVLRRDGSLLLASGYDAQTRTLAELDVVVHVPEEPARAAARVALAELEQLISDFPFVSPAHRSAWLAALLTPLARPAIDGPTPMLLLDASQRGSGKTLLADVIATIVTGADAPRRTAPETAEEWRKVLFAMLLAGDPLALIDNVTRMLSSAALDAILTGTTYQDRVLGVSEERRVAIRTTLIASTNNARVSTDLVRRTLLCRLEPNVEAPEKRGDFRIADLLGHVRADRVRYLSAALTILRAYVVAGRPKIEARPMGSYAAWSRVVRDALVWAGGVDPAETQDVLRESGDVERDELRDLLAAWHALLGEKPVTVRGLLDAAQTGLKPGERIASAGGKMAGRPLLDALQGVMPNGAEPTAHAIGNRLRALRGQIVGGLCLKEAGRDRKNVAQWRVLRGG